MNKETEIEEHPIPPFIPKECKVLIMGTFPPKQEYFKNKSKFFFYGSVRNHLWNRMDNIFFDGKTTLKWTKLSSESIEDNINKKKRFLEERKIGMIDYMSKIRRSKEGSSRDVDLIIEEDVLTNGSLIRILEDNPHIKAILCTYQLAYEELIKNPKFKYLNVEVIQLLPATRSRDKKEAKDKNYRENLKKFEIIIP